MKKIILLILTICMLASSVVVAHAEVREVYLSDLRIVYADSYEEAVKALENTEFDDYMILNSNLNKGTGEKGVWLAYQVTTDIEEAITDIAIMQMHGGYSEGNYQAMIEKSRKEYEAMGEVYLTAISHMIDAYVAGDFLAECAMRQLNFYIDPDSDMRLGDLFEYGVGADGLATIFLEGNKYALDNIRSLIAMGTSYNENGKNYLELVEEAAQEMTDNPLAFEYDELDILSVYVGAGITTFKGMFEEYEAVKSEMDFTDEEITELELDYLEYDYIATMFKDVIYLDGKTLYEFCLGFEYNEEDLTCLYPLVAAMNDGQRAMTEAAHYYDVVRYGSCVAPEDQMREELDKLEETYADNPFDIYTGVDRSIYDGTFALTTEADRANISTEDGLMNHLFGRDAIGNRIIEGSMATVSIALFAFGRAIKSAFNETVSAEISRRATELAAERIADFEANVFGKYVFKEVWTQDIVGFEYKTVEELLNNIAIELSDDYPNLASMSLMEKYRFLQENSDRISSYDLVLDDLDEAYNLGVNNIREQSGREVAAATTQQYAQMSTIVNYATAAMYIVGGVLTLASAISLGISVYSYYNPDYDDIPSSMVDLIDTEDGDRYIKYDAVTMINPNKKGGYDPADLNAFEAKRWNAMYITKSYEAGKPVCEGFNVSYDNSTPDKKYVPVHRFGEEVCYNLNKYNFSSKSPSIYLSIMQSDNQKPSATKVPPVVGSMISAEYFVIAGVGGLVVGAGVAFATKFLLDKKKKSA